MTRSWRIIPPDEVDENMLGEVWEDGLYTRSPCLIPIIVPVGFGLMQALIELHTRRIEDAVIQTLKAVFDAEIDSRVQADFLVGYGLLKMLVLLLEDSHVEACEYVLAIPDAPAHAGDVAGFIVQARDIARAARAKHAARDALRGI